MDTYKNFIWLEGASPAFAEELSGSFVALLEGVPCTLELILSHQHLHGSLMLDGEIYEVRGFCSSVARAAYGVLLEPISNTPVALLKITPKVLGLRLELDMPDFEELVKLYEPRAFTFRRSSLLT